MIKPTIGRVVLFNDGVSDQRVPALIAYVYSDTVITIAGFDRDGNPFKATEVELIQDDSECTVGTAEWMPYQKEQAEKAVTQENNTTG